MNNKKLYRIIVNNEDMFGDLLPSYDYLCIGNSKEEVLHYHYEISGTPKKLHTIKRINKNNRQYLDLWHFADEVHEPKLLNELRKLCT